MNVNGFNNKYMIYGMLFAVSNRIQTIGDEKYAEITMKQHFLMITLELFGDKHPTLKELANAIGCSYQNVKRMVTSLEINGFAKIMEDDNDRRKLHIVMTEKFKKFSKENESQTQMFMRMLYEGLSDNELDCTMNTLKRMEENLLKIHPNFKN